MANEVMLNGKPLAVDRILPTGDKKVLDIHHRKDSQDDLLVKVGKDMLVLTGQGWDLSEVKPGGLFRRGTPITVGGQKAKVLGADDESNTKLDYTLLFAGQAAGKAKHDEARSRFTEAMDLATTEAEASRVGAEAARHGHNDLASASFRKAGELSGSARDAVHAAEKANAAHMTIVARELFGKASRLATSSAERANVAAALKESGL